MKKYSRILVIALAILGVAALGWAGFRIYIFGQQKQTVNTLLDSRCATLVVRTVVELKPEIEGMARMGIPAAAAGSHVVITPEVDVEIAKIFQGRNLQETALGSETGDGEKLQKVLILMQTRAPDAAAQCKLLTDAMANCLPSFPYYDWQEESCGTKFIPPAVEKLANYMRRNFSRPAPSAK